MMMPPAMVLRWTCGFQEWETVTLGSGGRVWVAGVLGVLVSREEARVARPNIPRRQVRAIPAQVAARPYLP